MMKSAFKLAVPPPSPERQALADAIAESAPVRAEVDKARTRAEKARGELARAADAVPASTAAVEAAKARLIDDPAADRAELRALRQAETDAIDDLDIAREIVAKAETTIIEAERAARYATEKLTAAADAVISSAFATVLDVAQRAGRDAAASAWVAEIVAESGDPFNGMPNSRDAAAVLNSHIRYGGSDGSAMADARQAAQAPWRAARAALLSDPDAALPKVP